MPPTNPEAFTPGEYIAEELEARGWSQLDLADILGRPAQAVNEIINAKRAITADTARGLAEAFGTSAQLWMNLQSAYDLARLQQADGSLVSRRAKLYEFAPVGEMQKRGWIEKSTNFEVVEAQVFAFFGIKSLDDSADLAAVARKSTGDWTPPQRAWLARAKQLARTQVTGKFSAKSLRAALDKLSLLKTEPEEIRHVPRILSEAGIRFLIVAPLANSKIDGACFWLSDNEPVVVLSFRYDRIDWFWHTLMHELGHVSAGDGKVTPTLDIRLVGNDAESDGKPEIELKADDFAVEFLVDQAELLYFIGRAPVFSRLKLIGFAKRVETHPGIVVGQLQHRKLIPYTNFRNLLTTVRTLIISNAQTDGWSDVAGTRREGRQS
jgi:HTH-type transcriptional regulator/antitoxin HigA